MVNRSCGSCSECCYSLGVIELNKPMFRRCHHVRRTKQGCCSVYKSRPESCSGFKCLWLDGYFTPKDRPDRLGAVFATKDLPTRQMIIAYATSSANEERLMELIQSMTHYGPVLRMDQNGSTRVFFLDRDIALVQAIQKQAYEPDKVPAKHLPMIR